MSIERFLAIYFPIRTKTLTSKKKLIVTMVMTAFAMAALNLHFFWTYKIHKRCSADAKYKLFLTQFWPWINFVFYSLLPFIIQIFTSIAIVLKIVHSNYIRKHSMNIREGGIKLTNMTVTLLSVSLVFMMATAPMVVYRLVSHTLFKINFWGTLIFFFGACVTLVLDIYLGFQSQGGQPYSHTSFPV